MLGIDKFYDEFGGDNLIFYDCSVTFLIFLKYKDTFEALLFFPEVNF